MADLVVLNLGAGVQSTTLALMAAEGEFDRMPDCAIFADTGWEPPAVYRHLEWLKTVLPFPVYTVQQGNIRDDILAGAKGGRLAQPPVYLRHPDGTKGQIRRACTYEYKVRPLEQKVRELIGMRPRQRKTDKTVERWYGISADEIQRMRDSDIAYITNRYPLVEKRMTRHDCLKWCDERGYPRPPKSACVGCPYRSNASWQEMKLHRPEEFADAVEIDKVIRHGVPGLKLPAYLHSDLVPLDEADLRSATQKMLDAGQLPLFDDFDAECEGFCGV